MTLNIVLCNSFAAAESRGAGSSATELGSWFVINGITTNILASVGIVGFYPEVLDGQESLLFLTATKSQRLSVCVPNIPPNLINIDTPVRFTEHGFTPRLVAMEPQLLAQEPLLLTQELKTSSKYMGAIDRNQAIKQLQSAAPREYLLRDSSITHPENKIFCLSMKNSSGVSHHLLVIMPNNELYVADIKGKPVLTRKVNFMPGVSLTDAIESAFDLVKSDSSEAIASSSVTSSSSPVSFFSMPGTKPITSTFQRFDLYPVGYTRELSETLEDGERESRLIQLVDLAIDDCVKNLNNISISKMPEDLCNRKHYLEMEMSPGFKNEIDKLQLKEITELNQYYRILGFIRFMERRASQYFIKWTIADRLFRINILSAFLGKEVSEHTLKESLSELKQNWELPKADYSETPSQSIQP